MTSSSHLRPAAASRLRPTRRSARVRLTAVYGGFFLLSAAVLVAITYGLFERATAYTEPQLPKIPRAAAVHNIQPLPALEAAERELAQAQQQLEPGPAFSPKTPAPSATAIGSPPATLYTLKGNAVGPLAQAQQQLQHVERQLALAPNRLVLPLQSLAAAERELALAVEQVGRAVPQLARAHRQLARAQLQLTAAVRQAAEAGSVQAAQRAVDSHQLLIDSGIALAVVAVLALLAAWLVASRMLRPIRTIAGTARRISSSNLHERLSLEGPEDELKELGDTLDDLFARLEAAFQAQRHFVANASHELRTPLTRERTLIEVALGDPTTSQVWRSTGEELLASNRQQETLIEALLTLASSEGGLEHRELTDLATICREVLARPSLDPGRLGLDLEVSLHPARFEGDPRLVERLVVNLVDNAVAHNRPQGHLQVSTGVKDGTAVLSVVNTGPVVPAADLDRLFEPFQRLEGRWSQRRSGHGLGLSIVRAIADAHGALIRASARPDGGLVVEVNFPAPSLGAGRAEMRAAVQISAPAVAESEAPARLGPPLRGG